jgi:toxin YoeB
MSKYQVEFTDDAKNDIKLFEKAGNKKSLSKIDKLIDELYDHPRTGTGHPERLKHYLDIECWSRRITDEHRLVYEIHDDVVIVLVLSAHGHYNDK